MLGKEGADPGHILRGVSRSRWNRLARLDPGMPDPLSAEVAARHAATLDAINLPEGPVLDVGCGLGTIPLAGIPEPLRLDWIPWRGARAPALVGDAERLPLASGTFALVWSNLCLPWLGVPQEFFAEARRVLREGGLLAVSTLGPETLAEVDARAPPGGPRTLGFLDMHDLADMAMRAGFAEPVALRESIEFVYPSAEAMLGELRTFGALAASGMETHLGQRRTLRALSGGEPPFRLGFEVVYLHAWAMPSRAPKEPQMWQEIRIDSAKLESDPLRQ